MGIRYKIKVFRLFRPKMEIAFAEAIWLFKALWAEIVKM
jgi:hypothetical protein